MFFEYNIHLTLVDREKILEEVKTTAKATLEEMDGD